MCYQLKAKTESLIGSEAMGRDSWDQEDTEGEWRRVSDILHLNVKEWPSPRKQIFIQSSYSNFINDSKVQYLNNYP